MISTKTTKLIVIALTVAALTLAATTLAAININRDIPSSGSVITTPDINIYSNSECTENLTSIDWGSIEAGQSTPATLTLIVASEITDITNFSNSITISGTT
jgi:hypothetical protein